MIIELSRDIEKYRETIAMGLTAKQTVFSAASVVTGGGLILLLYPFMGLTVSAYVAIPVIAPIALGGFYSYHGMGFYEVLRKKMQMTFFNRALSYESTENEAVIKQLLSEEERQERVLKKKRKKELKQEKRVQRGGKCR